MVPLAASDGLKGSKWLENEWFFNEFKIALGPAKSMLGAPKAPPENLLFSGRAQVGVLGPPNKNDRAPPTPIWGQGGVNEPPRALKRRTVQVRIQKYI